MIVCPNCNHHNPEGAAQCESCYTPLPELMPCPNCGAPVQIDANFCGQCGFSTQAQAAVLTTALESPIASQPENEFGEGGSKGAFGNAFRDDLERDLGASATPDSALEETALAADLPTEEPAPSIPEANIPVLDISEPEEPPTLSVPSSELSTFALEPRAGVRAGGNSATQLQIHRAALVHVRSDTEVYLPDNLPVVHIGKPNDRIPPDIDVSGFPDSEVVSRVHADIRVEGDAYYIEDLGSANGTYVNNLPLAPGNRHRLRMGDRIALGKGDLVTFLFQVS
jgi:ribosomal protein L40E